jgi:CRISPR-associated protein Cas1
MLLAQTSAYQNKKKRMEIARKFIEGAAFNMIKNLRYYNIRGKDLDGVIGKIDEYSSQIVHSTVVDDLMGIEGNIRQTYYEGFDLIINDYSMEGRSKQPPRNEVNALISFGNMMCY